MSSKNSLAIPLCLLVMGLAIACGSESPEKPSPAQAAADPAARGDSGSKAGACPPAMDVGRIVEIPMAVLHEGTRTYGGTRVCAYEASAEPRGVTVSIVSGPVAEQPQWREELQQSARTMAGRDATGIDVGAGGLAYGTRSKSEAATTIDDQLYQADITAFESIGDKREAMVELLRLAAR